jgi:hypothetical protein
VVDADCNDQKGEVFCLDCALHVLNSENELRVNKLAALKELKKVQPLTSFLGSLLALN